ncbi:hypothetical protein Kpol_473p11 [Vanderwaltozyma polyspora DSM 70294]|uniref:Enhancer of translation termination 1 n=1 Tax=Vanderwaltozyma polyspora (strain ATCC 22028 / DSM 70294 / BCRC 21397 / CBS 2163 / NBRC 10782 / NRRL Y-8283 / UCD 57-17) TaxID=436907 RepID=ETT1_VANPO|nr:uncharacterized protein Kpol_473p11 [Vanderwaltozyma polyspora DSM 70294]A7TQ03.1 RecName: Full=Enhancer of translation termination 1 [Vanderwaltozyma polyspora DSM 70294]EDO15652.1 hypothetical protein Kpol_473p11 [Vanderwaltozyma polyspora DSM 70294]
MAKRALGLGQKNREKKRKVESGSEGGSRNATPTVTNQIQIELGEGVDPDNELAQLHGLWLNYFKSERDDEYMLNGIVHECDRLIRQAQEDEEMAKQLNDRFHAIYALALSELTIFKAAEEEGKERKLVSEFFGNALDRLSYGQAAHPDSNLLKLVFAKILLQRIPLEYIFKLEVDSEEKLDLHQKLEDAKKNFVIVDSDLELSYEVLNMLNDLLDIVENFGHEDDIEEGLDSDDEDGIDLVELKTTHPLYQIQQQVPENYQWLRSSFDNLLESIKEKDSELFRSVARSIGELLLKEAEEPASTYLSIIYGNEDDDEDVEPTDESKEAQKKAQELTKKALEYLEKAQNEEDPKTWVQVAEAQIDLGNLLDYQSSEQESAYKKAEDILRKANKATKGKFQFILDNLLEKE